MQPRQVRDVMTRRVVTATADTPVGQVARLLAVHRVNAVPIVDGNRRVVGVVSEADIRPGTAGTAGEVMSVRPPTVPADAPLSVAALKLEHTGAERLLVTGDGGRLLGVVLRADVLRPLTRPDTAIHDPARTAGVYGGVDIGGSSGQATAPHARATPNRARKGA